jgi:hypothetical protein
MLILAVVGAEEVSEAAFMSRATLIRKSLPMHCPSIVVRNLLTI